MGRIMVTALRIPSHRILSSHTNAMVDLIQSFPRLESLTVPITSSLLLNEDFRKAALRLNDLRELTFKIRWPNHSWCFSLMDLSILWQLVQLNSQSLDSLRVNFCHFNSENLSGCPDPGIFEKCQLLSSMRDAIAILEALGASETYFPLRNIDWPKQLNLKVLQFRWFDCNETTDSMGVYGGLKFLRLETLEILSLTDCPDVCDTIHSIADQLVSLRYLQLSDRWPCITKLEELLLGLPRSLIALSLRIRGTVERPLDYLCLDRHRETLRSLFLWTDSANLFAKSRWVRRDTGRREKISVTNFRGWTNLEELVLSVGVLACGLTNFALPESLKTLYIEDRRCDHLGGGGGLFDQYLSDALDAVAPEDLWKTFSKTSMTEVPAVSVLSDEKVLEEYSKIVQDFARRQRARSTCGVSKLQGVAIFPTGRPQVYSDPVYLKIAPCEAPKRSKISPRVDVTSKADFRRSFGDVNFPPREEALWSWVDACRNRWGEN
ncbi:hypothetical protein Dda_1459 [Drechslerella dactyloides]|uniref:Uncharacterized protein n=1 Tax=Drechslerella dactyloides TaxID=74499 RepID=A0AAD6NKN0_DREDA|nr:hypothetical protein Dda_1459 [Drechslerella dactyloides]